MKYLVELKHISNENYELPSNLKKFEVNSNGMDEAIKIFRNRLDTHMSDKDDYFVEAGQDYENYLDISFGDALTGQDVRYTITKY
ncbi:hypothetical protein ACFX4N_23400 [Priestia sp. YIM B13551]|uniref:hypothetical protein n=1 Tax=Priestia sp. YIM B13551 TaxID=3366306 RepID=UPI00366EFE8D